MKRRIASVVVGVALALAAARVAWTLHVREDEQLHDAARQQALRVWTDLRADLTTAVELVDRLGRAKATSVDLHREMAAYVSTHPEISNLCSVSSSGAVVDAVASTAAQRGLIERAVASTEWRRTLDAATRSRAVCLSSPIELAAGVSAMLLVRALEGGSGGVVAVICFNGFVSTCLDADLKKDCSVEVWMDRTLVHASGVLGAARDVFEDNEVLDGHTWRVRVQPATGARPLASSLLPEAIVGGGVVFGGLISVLSVMLATLHDKSSSLQALNLRLSRANVDLECQIHERQRLEAALERQIREVERSNAELEQFAYAASHDLQEPLRMVASYTQMLAERYRGRLDAKADTYIEFAVDGARRMQRLISDLLAYARTGTGQFESVSLADVVDECRAALSGAIRDADAVVDATALPVVRGRRAQLLQLVQNLMSNAIKFARPGHPPRVQIRAEETVEGWLLSVTDDGIGIDPQHSERIFKMFERLHPRGRYPGTGIGLALCRKIATQHGGRIWIEPREGGGTTVRVLLAHHPDPALP